MRAALLIAVVLGPSAVAQCPPVGSCPFGVVAFTHSPRLDGRPGVLPVPCVRPGTEGASVYLDGLGVPHVVASSEAAALYALGRQHMRDFPSACAVNIWGSTGRLASLVGPGPRNRYAELDFEARTWRYPEAAIGHWNGLVQSPGSPVLGLLCAYTDGLNDGRVDVCAELSAPGLANLCGQTSEPLNGIQLANLLGEPFAPVDVLCFSQRFLAFFPRETIAAIRRGDGASCTSLSNMWAISPGARAPEPGTTATGPLLGSDPHLSPFASLFRAAFASIHVQGGSLDAGGWWVPGLPGPPMGGTDATAWAATGGAVASVGVWQAQAQGSIQAPPATLGVVGTFAFSGAPRDIYGRAERIDVRDPSGTQLLTWSRDLYWADPYSHGPAGLHYPAAVERDGSDRFEYVGAAFTTTPVSLFAFLVALLRSQSMADIDAAIAMNVMVDQNLIAVAADGSMRYWLAGRRPDRTGQAMADAWSVLDGNSASEVWNATLVVSSSAWPREVMGPSGGPEVWINNNTDPRHTRRPTTIIPPSPTPWTLTTCAVTESYRQLRARALLDPGSPAVPPSGLTRADSIRTLMDVRDNWADAMLPYFATAYIDLLGQGLVDATKAATVVAFTAPLLDGTWSPRDARPDCEYAARAFTLRHTYAQLMAQLRGAWGIALPKLLGERGEPGTFPPLTSFAASSVANGLSDPHALDLLTMGVALEFAAVEVWPSVVLGNPCWIQAHPTVDPFTAPQVTSFPNYVPWTCVSPPTTGCPLAPSLTLGQMRWLDLSRNGVDIYFPMGGVFDSLFASPTLEEGLVDLSHYAGAMCAPMPPMPSVSAGITNLRGLAASFGFDVTTPVSASGRFLSPQVSGSRSILSIDLSTPVRYHYSAAVGPTERLFDVRRYAPAPCFAARAVTLLEMDPAMVTAGGAPVSVWTY